MQRKKCNSGQMPAAKIIERLVLWYEFDSHGKLSHVKIFIKEKYPHTIITERYRFCCFISVEITCNMMEKHYTGVFIR